MSSPHRSFMPKSFPLFQLENSTAAQSAVIYNHSTTLAPIKSILDYTLDGLFNATNEFYKNTTNVYGDLSNENITRFENHTNQTSDGDELFQKDHVFDRTDVRVIFIVMYSVVFCCCFFGKF